MAFSLNLLHLLLMVSPLLLCSAASRRLLDLKTSPTTMQFGVDSPSLLFQPTLPTPTVTPQVGDSLLPHFPLFQEPALPPPTPPVETNVAPIFPFPSLPSLPTFPPFPFIPTMPLSSPTPPITLLLPPPSEEVHPSAP